MGVGVDVGVPAGPGVVVAVGVAVGVGVLVKVPVAVASGSGAGIVPTVNTAIGAKRPKLCLDTWPLARAWALTAGVLGVAGELLSNADTKNRGPGRGVRLAGPAPRTLLLSSATVPAGVVGFGRVVAARTGAVWLVAVAGARATAVWLVGVAGAITGVAVKAMTRGDETATGTPACMIVGVEVLFAMIGRMAIGAGGADESAAA